MESSRQEPHRYEGKRPLPSLRQRREDLLPLAAILLPPAAFRAPVTILAVLIALGVAGAVSARIGGSDIRRSVLRLVIGGALGLGVTYGIGHLVGAKVFSASLRSSSVDSCSSSSLVARRISSGP